MEMDINSQCYSHANCVYEIKIEHFLLFERFNDYNGLWYSYSKGLYTQTKQKENWQNYNVDDGNSKYMCAILPLISFAWYFI